MTHPLWPLMQAGASAGEVKAFIADRPPQAPATPRRLARDAARLRAGALPSDAELEASEEQWHGGADINSLADGLGMDVDSLISAWKRIHRRSKNGRIQ